MFCPKCREPLDGPEEYICCGDGILEWRCQDCGKVSEGFAFPYGRCPMCSGVLEALDRRRTDDAASLGTVRMAFEIELGGHAFYARAGEATAEPELRALFAGLAEMEREHIATLSRRYHVPAPSTNAPSTNAPSAAAQSGGAPSGAVPSGGAQEGGGDASLDCAAIFGGLERHPADPLNLLRIAIACEARAAEFFDTESRRLPMDSMPYRLCRELAAEEREHADLLATELERRQQGKPGLL